MRSSSQIDHAGEERRQVIAAFGEERREIGAVKQAQHGHHQPAHAGVRKENDLECQIRDGERGGGFDEARR